MKQTLKIDLNTLCFDKSGLIPVILQDSLTGEILMLAWANKQSLEKTLELGEMVFWSRSRSELWHKGESSGNIMTVKELRADCDRDTLLAIVEPAGPACHTGVQTCFHQSIWGQSRGEGTFLGKLWRYLKQRASERPENSYTVRLLESSYSRVGQKIGEEGLETALTVATQDKKGFISEAADLLYHLTVGCLKMDVSPSEIFKELEDRHNKA